ncbi:hypothetical protein [Geodermatophilus sp. URMC 64]
MADVDDEVAPPFPVERPASRPWREGAVTRANELETLRRWLDSLHAEASEPGRTARRELSTAIHRHLEIARRTAAGDRSVWRGMTGASLQRTASNLDAAEATLLRLAPAAYLEGQLPGLLTHVRRYLAVTDARRVELEALVAQRQATKRSQNGGRTRASSARVEAFTEEERGVIVAAVRAASSEEVRALMQAQSFRNTLVVTSTILILLAAMAAVLSISSPATVPLCFAPQSDDRVTVVCPTSQRAVREDGADAGTTPSEAVDETIRDAAGRWDLLTVEALGLAAAAISATVALRKVRGSSTPLAIPVALAVLKLPLGALTAVLGILLMRGGFVPGLSALDSSAQILAWAVVFGYAQQTFTRFVDQQAGAVLDRVKSQPSVEIPAAATEAAARHPAPDGGDTTAGQPEQAKRWRRALRRSRTTPQRS